MSCQFLQNRVRSFKISVKKILANVKFVKKYLLFHSIKIKEEIVFKLNHGRRVTKRMPNYIMSMCSLETRFLYSK